MTINVDADEIANFERVSARWWDPRGPMGPLHTINPVRLRYIEKVAGGLAGKRVVDIGCGGGILTESLAAAGADALGIDLAGASLHVAEAHARGRNIRVAYRLVSAEELAAEQPQGYDLVCCMEMLEHVPDPAAVVEACSKLTKPGGSVVLSTINRNPKSYALMILAAEHALGLLPRGTHDYARFIRPSELDRWARDAGLDTKEIIGLRYNPLLKSAALHSSDIDVNYLMFCRKTFS
jgi:2-polyprenyl-6-hydroxyphenyl methylase/3-demethylubiquinone-9 3-methyltransferase